MGQSLGGRGPEAPHNLLDAVGRFVHRLVLPHADDRPAERGESCVRLPVALDVAIELRRPVVGVGLRRSAVDRAAVPEAAIDEDCDTGTREDDVRPGAQGAVNPEIDSEAKATPVELSTDRELWRRANATVCHHDGAR